MGRESSALSGRVRSVYVITDRYHSLGSLGALSLRSSPCLVDYLRWDDAGPPVGLLLLTRAAGDWWDRLVRQ